MFFKLVACDGLSLLLNILAYAIFSKMKIVHKKKWAYWTTAALSLITIILSSILVVIRSFGEPSLVWWEILIIVGFLIPLLSFTAYQLVLDAIQHVKKWRKGEEFKTPEEELEELDEDDIADIKEGKNEKAS